MEGAIIIATEKAAELARGKGWTLIGLAQCPGDPGLWAALCHRATGFDGKEKFLEHVAWSYHEETDAFSWGHYGDYDQAARAFGTKAGVR